MGRLMWWVGRGGWVGMVFGNEDIVICGVLCCVGDRKMIARVLREVLAWRKFCEDSRMVKWSCSGGGG